MTQIEPPIIEFSQDEIDLMITALDMWEARIQWERADGRQPDLGHRWAGAYVKARVTALVNKLKAW